MTCAYYNENDPFAAKWLAELIAAKLIADGEIDDRAIQTVTSNDLRGYSQHHFFAGIGVWSYALRGAGWPDDKPVWSGSCPCQPFSAAGKRGGFADERHLWPVWFDLIRKSQPKCVFGEQVASKDGLAWLDAVSSDMEGAGYAIGAVDTCAAGFGAPHIRQRLYFVADSQQRGGYDRRWVHRRCVEESAGGEEAERRESGNEVEGDGVVIGLADDTGNGRREECSDIGRNVEGSEAQRLAAGLVPSRSDDALGHTAVARLEGSAGSSLQGNSARLAINGDVGNAHVAGPQGFVLSGDRSSERIIGPTGLVSGFWRDARWLWCRDEKYRPVEPGAFPLAHGAANRVGRLRGYGNSLTAPQAQAFIEAYIECSNR